jgi:hypothetical protein
MRDGGTFASQISVGDGAPLCAARGDSGGIHGGLRCTTGSVAALTSLADLTLCI